VAAMTASTETKPTTQFKSRRALLAGALGGLGAWAASAIGRAGPVQAGTDGDVVLGVNNTATSLTQITNSANTDGAFRAFTNTPGDAIAAFSLGGSGVHGTSDTSAGVYGNSYNNIGVRGFSAAANQPALRGQSWGSHTGVHGVSGSTVPAAKPKTGVYGYANQDKDSKGVWGFSGKGAGLFGQANKSGYAIRSRGRVKFEKVSGVATIPAGSTTVTVSPNNVNVTSSSFVLLTPKANLGSRGLWYTTNPSADTITIHISSTRSSATKIAWLLLG